MKITNKKEPTSNKKLVNLINSLERKIDNLNKEKDKKEMVSQNTIEVVCSQDDIERTAKRKR